MAKTTDIIQFTLALDAHDLAKHMLGKKVFTLSTGAVSITQV